MGAAAWMGRLRAPTEDAAESTLLRLMRQELGMCVVRGHAQLLLSRARMARVQARGTYGAPGSPGWPLGGGALGDGGDLAAFGGDDLMYGAYDHFHGADGDALRWGLGG
jgi:hypothetical protein